MAIKAVEQAAALKRSPHRIADEQFLVVPRRMREALARLLKVPPGEIVLGNSATYGLQLFVWGLDWHDGDEVLVVADDFPANITPWLALTKRYGVKVRALEPRGQIVSAEEVADAAGERTRLLCTSWINSFNGAVLDISSVGAACRESEILFLLNASQGIGALPIEPARLPIDALTSSGFKWLCGPYGTGFAWIRASVLDRLQPAQAYWLALPDNADLDDALSDPYRSREALAHRDFDVFGTANFLNVIPWTAAVGYLEQRGIETIARHDARLVQRLLDQLDYPEQFRILSPLAPSKRSTIVVFSDQQPERNLAIHTTLTEVGIDTSLRNGAIRISAHLYNSPHEIDQLADAAARAATGQRRSRAPAHAALPTHASPSGDPDRPGR